MTNNDRINLSMDAELDPAQIDFENVALQYRTLVSKIDDIIYNGIYNRLAEKHEKTPLAELDEEIQRRMELLGVSNVKVLAYDDDDVYDALEKHLTSMVSLRRKMVEQELINDADDSIFSEQITQYSEMAEDRIQRVNKLQNNVDELRILKVQNHQLLDKVRALVAQHRGYHTLKGELIDDDVDGEGISRGDLDSLQVKYKKIVAKSIMLGQFVTDLISSLTCADISNDKVLLQMLMECGDYEKYNI
jgi:hypothetical protein